MSELTYFLMIILDQVHEYVNFIEMKSVNFYNTPSGRCPVQDHLDTLPDKTVSKIVWVLRAVRDLDPIPSHYFKKLVNTDDIWEVRIDVGRNTFRLLGFFQERELIIVTNSFQKKSQKTPQSEIRLATERKADYQKRRKTNG